MNYVLENANVNIEDLDPLADTAPPVIYFFDKVGDVISGATISVVGSNVIPVDTGMGITFSTSMSITTHGTGSVISKSKIVELLVDYSADVRDGLMQLSESNLLISGSAGSVNSITSVGDYTITFDYSDIALNYVNAKINLNISA